MITEETIATLRRFMETRERRDEAKKEHDEAKKEYVEAELDLFEALIDNPIKGALKVDLGDPWGVVSFAPRETYYAQIVDEEEALKHYEQRARIDEVTSPKFVMARLNEDVRDAMEGNGKMPPGVTYYPRRGVTVTRQKN
jgi:hypothetical protein